MEQVKKYLQLCKDNDYLPSVENFIVWLMENDGRNFTDASNLGREYKGYIDTYAIAFLKHKAGLGGRNSQNYIQLLKEYKEAENDLNDGIEAVNITIDIPEGKQEAKIVYEDKEGQDA